MRGIPIIGFAGFSGSGKTTLIEKIIPILKTYGLRVAVIKHDVHGLKFDLNGKDSRRFYDAGADCCFACNPEQTAVFVHNELTLEQMIYSLKNIDIVIVEGYKKSSFTQLGICRKATGKGFTADVSRFAALITDIDDIQADIPIFTLDDIEGVAEFMINNMDDFTHFNDQGRAKMVNVGDKEITSRCAVAGATVLVSKETFELIRCGGTKKGDVLTVAQIAGVMGAKKTPDIIPMCHPILLSGIDLELSLNEEKCSVEIKATVSCDGRTGVEMEALTAASVAALTVYDMCKAVQKDMEITNLRLLSKKGGIHGDYIREDEK